METFICCLISLLVVESWRMRFFSFSKNAVCSTFGKKTEATDVRLYMIAYHHRCSFCKFGIGTQDVVPALHLLAVLQVDDDVSID